MPEDTFSRWLETQLQMRQSQLKATQNSFWPDLSLGFRWNQSLFNLDTRNESPISNESNEPNEGEDSNSFTRSSFLAKKDEKEEWRISLQFNMPFSHGREKSQLAQAHFSFLESQIQKQQYKERKLILWKNQCKILRELFAVQKRLNSSYQQSKKMVRLREDLFRLGKKDAFQVIQSLREVSQQYFNLQKNKADIQKAAWKILRLEGKVLSYLKGLKLPPSLQTYVQKYKEKYKEYTETENQGR